MLYDSQTSLIHPHINHNPWNMSDTKRERGIERVRKEKGERRREGPRREWGRAEGRYRRTEDE